METVITTLAAIGFVNSFFGMVSVGRIPAKNVLAHVMVGTLGMMLALYFAHWDVTTILMARKAETLHPFIVCAVFLATFIPLVCWNVEKKNCEGK